MTRLSVPSLRLRRARLAGSILFFTNGALFATWVARIPTVKHTLNLSDGQLSLALLCFALGALVAFPLTGAFVTRFGSHKVTPFVVLGYCCMLPLVSFASGLLALSLALLFLGMFNGALNICVNTQGAAVEAEYGRSIFSSFHAMFSVGGLDGAGVGGLMVGQGLAPRPHFLIVALFLFGTFTLVWRHLHQAPPAPGGPLFAWPNRIVFGLGLIVACAFVGEGAMADWAGVYLHDIIHTSTAFAALGYTTFAMAMTITRFVGDQLINRFGARALVCSGGLISLTGLGTALAVDRPLMLLVGFACVGIGMATIAPLVFGVASRLPGWASGNALAAVTTMGYGGFLLGPAIIGGVAELVNLRTGLFGVAALGIIIALSSKAMPVAPSTKVLPDPSASPTA